MEDVPEVHNTTDDPEVLKLELGKIKVAHTIIKNELSNKVDELVQSNAKVNQLTDKATNFESKIGQLNSDLTIERRKTE